MNIVAIGDPHGDLNSVRKIPLRGVDLILLTGDLGRADLMRKMAFANVERRRKGMEEIEYSSKEQKRAFMEAFNSSIEIVKYLSKFAPVFLIYGNVENTNSETRKLSGEIGIKLPFLDDALKKIKNVRVINNKKVNFKNIKIGGLKYFVDESWVKEFKPSDYSERLSYARTETKKAKKVMNKFGEIEILVCHQPPYGVLDKVNFKSAPKEWKGKHAGSRAVLNFIRKKKPRYVFCGHIHEGEGRKKVWNTEVYNLGVCGYNIIEI